MKPVEKPLKGKLEKIPALLLMGRIYRKGLTGRLDLPGDDGLVFWFKRGYPCHSAGPRDTRLGELVRRLVPRSRLALLKALRRQRKDGKLLGQQLIALGLVDATELERLLSEQLRRRMSQAARLKCGDFEIHTGMDCFGPVPISSGPVNPIPMLAEACATAPLEDLSWLVEKVEGRELRMVEGRRVPPSLQDLEPDGMSRRLLEWQTGSWLLRSPRSQRLTAMLLSFGYLEVKKAQPVAEAPPVQEDAPPAPRQARPGLTMAEAMRSLGAKTIQDKLSALRRGATMYELIEVSPLASSREVKARYRNLAFRFHPDKAPADARGPAHSLFSEITRAYHTLSSQEQRLAYDRSLVLGGEWVRLGDAQDLYQVFRKRSDQALNRGRLQASTEYQRLAGEMSRIMRWSRQTSRRAV